MKVDENEMERAAYDFWEIAKEVIKKIIQLLMIVHALVKEGMQDLYRGEKFE